MKLLVIEDEEDLSKGLMRGLLKSGYQPEAALDGQSGLQMALANTYDCILLDLNLPLMGGMDVLNNIRKTNQTTPILILSSRHDVEDKILGLDEGASDYLVKPFHFQELLARIRSLLRRKVIQNDTVLICEELRFDLCSQQVSILGNILDFTTREYQILEYLVLNQERYISAEELIEHVWQSDTDLFSNAFKVHISVIRKKIAQYTNANYIQCKRMMGYKLALEVV